MALSRSSSGYTQFVQRFFIGFGTFPLYTYQPPVLFHIIRNQSQLVLHMQCGCSATFSTQLYPTSIFYHKYCTSHLEAGKDIGFLIIFLYTCHGVASQRIGGVALTITYPMICFVLRGVFAGCYIKHPRLKAIAQ